MLALCAKGVGQQWHYIYPSEMANAISIKSHVAMLPLVGNPPQEILDTNIRTVNFDQYEVGLPVATMADCWQGLLELLYGADNIDGGSESFVFKFPNGGGSQLTAADHLPAAPPPHIHTPREGLIY